MTLEEFKETNWHRGNIVQLNNGKEYVVKGIKGHGKYLLLYSEEYDVCFVADEKIIMRRTSDYEEPAEVYEEKKRLKQEFIKAQAEALREIRRKEKEERRQKNIQADIQRHLDAVERKAEKQRQKQKAQHIETDKEQPKDIVLTKLETKPQPAEKSQPKLTSKSKESEKPMAKGKNNTAKETTPQPGADTVRRKRKRITLTHTEKVIIK